KLRFCIFSTLVIALLVFAVSLLIMDGKAMTPVNYKNIYVYQGDTLWSIASRYLPKGTDLRSFILEIKTVNDIDKALIYTGQELIIPIYPDSKELAESKTIASIE
ncbi:MAG: LysM peptidoglycan-binding domain-containing protein, partial [Clostridiales bacterium]|nr:LysM peptidoglycan-binding domain-containing protein [Clostridiales bacterium]